MSKYLKEFKAIVVKEYLDADGNKFYKSQTVNVNMDEV